MAVVLLDQVSAWGKFHRIFWASVRGGGNAIAEDLVAAVLDGGTVHCNQDGGACGCNDVDAIKLVQSRAGTVDISAVKPEDVEGIVGAGQVQLAELDGSGPVRGQLRPEGRSAFQIALSLGEVNGVPVIRAPLGLPMV